MAATVLMVAVPLIVVWVTSQVLYFKLPTLSALVLSLVLSFGSATLLSRVWERRSKTAEVSFGELMIWSWFRLHKAERKIEKGLQASQTSASHDEQLQVLHELTAALESKDPYTRGHSRRVERHSFKTGVALGLDLADVEILRMSASLHDVGKIRVSNRVLHKPGKLTDEERSLIEQHPVLGAGMVASIGEEKIVQAVRHHHERWDGRGYPDGTAGTETPLFSRVIAVADSYDAIRSNRSYRRGVSRDQAVQILTDESGRQFDAKVVEAFLTTLPARGRAVAAFTSLATGPGALWRYLQQLFQRFGSSALAPAIGAAGTAVILGTSSLLTPTLPARASALIDTAQPSSSGGPSSSATLAGAGSRDRDLITARARADARRIEQRQDRQAALRQERRTAERKKRAAARQQTAAAGTPDGGTVATAPTGNTGGPTSGGSGSTNSPTTSQPDPATTAPAPTSGDSGGQEATTGDPNGEGKDCRSGSRERSKGYRLHCG